jgi:hypothetical protein
MIAALAGGARTMGRGGAAALAAALDRQAEREKRARLTVWLHQWGEYQREGYEQAGIDYGRPRVIGNAPGSKLPAPEWYITLVAAISTLPHADQQALRWAYVVQDGNNAGRAFDALLALVGEG